MRVLVATIMMFAACDVEESGAFEITTTFDCTTCTLDTVYSMELVVRPVGSQPDVPLRCDVSGDYTLQVGQLPDAPLGLSTGWETTLERDSIASSSFDYACNTL